MLLGLAARRLGESPASYLLPVSFFLQYHQGLQSLPRLLALAESAVLVARFHLQFHSVLDLLLQVSPRSCADSWRPAIPLQPRELQVVLLLRAHWHWDLPALLEDVFDLHGLQVQAQDSLGVLVALVHFVAPVPYLAPLGLSWPFCEEAGGLYTLGLARPDDETDDSLREDSAVQTK